LSDSYVKPIIVPHISTRQSLYKYEQMNTYQFNSKSNNLNYFRKSKIISSEANMCFFDNRCDQNLTVVVDVAWWMEAVPPQIISPAKPSVSPILETILEGGETEEDNQEQENEDV